MALAGKVSKSVSQKDTAKLELRKVLQLRGVRAESQLPGYV